jgi:GNAT superfamily N-acetyltransferase
VTATAAALSIGEVPVRRLDEADLPAIFELAADRGWPPEEAKWRLMFAVSEPYGVPDPAGGLAGAVVLTRYGWPAEAAARWSRSDPALAERPALHPPPGRAPLATVGMMLVASRHGRRGLGRRLMEHVLARAGDAVVYLTATPAGRPLYERLGFRVVDTSVTYRGFLRPESAEAEAASATRPVATADLAAIAAVDQQVFGAERNRVLAELVTFADRFELLDEPATTGHGAALTYGAAWSKDGRRLIGPLVAASTVAAARLVCGLAAGWPGDVRLDILGRHQDLAAWAAARGLAPVNESALMVYGGDLPGERDRLYCPVSVAIG